MLRVEAIVRPIIEAVRSKGDSALVEYARKFDGLGDQPLLIPASGLADALAAITRESSAGG